MAPGIDDKGAAEPKLAFPPADGVFVEVRRRQVPMHHPEMAHSLLLEVEAGRASGHRFVRLVQASLLRRPAGGFTAEPLLFTFDRKIIPTQGTSKPNGLRRNRR